MEEGSAANGLELEARAQGSGRPTPTSKRFTNLHLIPNPQKQETRSLAWETYVLEHFEKFRLTDLEHTSNFVASSGLLHSPLR
jgi:hypothetical protein